MKAISLTQPWATLAAIGAKKIETRGWNTTHRGETALHSSATFPKAERRLCFDNPFFNAALRAAFPELSMNEIVESLPLGKVIAKFDLLASKPMWIKGVVSPDVPFPGTPEREFGTYHAGRYMFFMGDMRPLAVPVAVKGKLNIWEWPEL